MIEDKIYYNGLVFTIYKVNDLFKLYVITDLGDIYLQDFDNLVDIGIYICEEW